MYRFIERIGFSMQGVNLKGFHASMNHRFEDRLPDFMDGITDFMEQFNTF